MAYITPGIRTREVDVSQRVPMINNLLDLYRKIDEGWMIYGADGQIVLGKGSDGDYIIPDPLLNKLKDIDNPDIEMELYLDRIGYDR